MKINKKFVKKILILISIIILILGIISGINVSNELVNNSNTNNIYVDGTDFSGMAELGVFFGSKILGIVIIFYSILIDIVIWLIYGIIIFILKMIDRLRNKRKW